MASFLREQVLGSTQARARETPNVANQVQYPEEFNNYVPVISVLPLEKKKMDTMIIATQSQGYSEESFNTDVRKTVEYFQLEDGMYQAILLKSVPEDLQVLDSADAADKLRRVVEMMNRNSVRQATARYRDTHDLPTGETEHIRATREVTITNSRECTLRIVSVGVKTSGFLFTALEYMMNHWRAPVKYVQFITNGELERGSFSDFWKSACINQLVEAVQYVNLASYLPFGYYKGKCKKLNKTGPAHAD